MATTIKNQALDLTTRLESKVISATRDMTAAGAPTDVAYTGVGFKPTSIQAIAIVGGLKMPSIGFADSAKINSHLQQDPTDVWYIDDFLVWIYSSAGASQKAIVKSYDADGFTLTWTKTGSPTGTAQLRFLCLR